MTSPLLVRRISLDVLQRNPTGDEMAQWSARAPAEIVRTLLGTQEAMATWLEEELLYFLLLDNFRPTTPAVTSLPQRMHARKVDVRTATAEILLSTGFSLRNPGNDTFVTVVLEQCLGLEVQDSKHAPLLDAGKKVYDGYTTRFLSGVGKTQADVVKLALADRRCTRHLLDRHHRRLFAQPLPPSAEATVDVVHEAPAAFFDVLAQWQCSERYLDPDRPRRDLSHHQFARSLYLDLLGRVPTYDELRMVRNALLAMADPAPLRAVLGKIILDSGKAKLPPAPSRATSAAFVRQAFLTYLRREPADAEVETFTRELEAGQNPNPALVVRALLGSREYASY
jgi:hypothetical protein